MGLQLIMAPRQKTLAQELIAQIEQELSVEQSLELVKIFLNSSIACVCYTRELLRWTSDCLRTRYIEQVSLNCDEPSQIYQNFLNTLSETPTSSQQVRVLVRSENERANCILNMLEHGVFDALKLAYLDTLQVFVATNAGDLKSIIEAYTYHFDYENNRVASVRVAEIAQPFTLQRSQKSFKAAIRGLLRAMQEMPPLPNKCVMGMSMSYKEGCPDLYEPVGFVHGPSPSVAPQHWDTLWNTPSSFAASFESTHHNVQVAARGPWSLDPATSQLQDTIMSKELQNMQKTSSSRNHALQSTIPHPRTPGSKRKDSEHEESMQPLQKRTRNAKEGGHAGSKDSSWPQVTTGNTLQAGLGFGKAAADEGIQDRFQENPGCDEKLTAPYRRKKSISQAFVALGSSTPVSQRCVDEIASEEDVHGKTRSSRAPSTASDI